MIVNDRFATYINSLSTGNTPFLDEIERDARANYVPVIRPETQTFLKFLLALKRPQQIIEVGSVALFTAPLFA